MGKGARTADGFAAASSEIIIPALMNSPGKAVVTAVWNIIRKCCVTAVNAVLLLFFLSSCTATQLLIDNWALYTDLISEYTYIGTWKDFYDICLIQYTVVNAFSTLKLKFIRAYLLIFIFSFWERNSELEYKS